MDMSEAAHIGGQIRRLTVGVAQLVAGFDPPVAERLAIVTAESVSKSYRSGPWPWRPSRPVLRGADLRISRGEIVGLVGENGSGKSTLMRVLVGSLGKDGGRVEVDGSIGYCPQDPILYQRLTCDEHLELFGRAYGMDAAAVAASRLELYDALGFGEWARSRVDELSGGTRAKLNLAIALLADPDVLFLDEPYAGFDWDTYQRFWELTRRRRAAGRGVLIISHFIADEERFDRIYRLIDGQAVEQ
jgi:ABC-type multidrug transport system ATPase subunit